MKKNDQPESEILRQKAEALLKKRPAKTVSPPSEAEMQRLIHELEVHQIELEIQNEELIVAKTQAAIDSEKYIELYDFAPSGYFTLSISGKIIELNLLGAKMLGKDRSQLKGRLFQLFVSVDTKPVFDTFLVKAFNSKIPETCDLTLTPNSGSLLNIHLMGNASQNGEHILLTAVDITERKNAELELHNNAELLRQLLETLPIGIWITDRIGNITRSNPAGRQIWEGEKLVGIDQYGEYKGWWAETGKLIEPEEWAAARAISKGEVSINELIDIQCFDGTKKTIYNSALPIRDSNGSIIGSVIVNQDITRQRQAEKELIKSEYLKSIKFYLEKIKTSGSASGRWFVHTKSGERRIWEYNNTLRTDVIGSPIVRGMAMDITERIKAEEEARQSSERLELFFSQSLAGFFFMMLDEPICWDETVDKEKMLDYVFAHQRVTKINEAMLKQYRATEEQILNFTPNDFFAHDLENGRKVWRDLFDQGQFHVDTTEKRFDGSEMIVEGDYICLYDSQGRITGHFGVQHDVTKYRQTEKELRESEEKFSKAVLNAPFPIMIHAEDGKVEIVNDEWLKITGYTKDEISTVAKWTEKAYGIKKEMVREDIEKLYNISGKVDEGEYVIATKSGDKRNWYFSSTPLGKLNDGRRIAMSMALDVSERKLAEAALADSEKRYHDLFDSNPLPMWVYDLKTLALLEVNETAMINYGYSREEFLQMTLKDIRPEEEIIRLIDDVGKNRPEYQKSGEWKHQRKDGTLLDVEITSHIIDYKGKKSVLVLSQDVTERKQIQSELRKSEERYSAFVKQSSEATCLFELEHAPVDTQLPVETQIDLLYEHAVITENNKTFATSHGYNDPAEMNGIKIGQIFPRLAKENLNYLRSFITGNYSTSQVETKEMSKDGSVTYFLSSLIGSVEDGHLVRIWGTKQDISRIKQVEAEIRLLNAELEQRVIDRTNELMVANKELESFSYSVSHDLRAPLRAISGFTNILKEDYSAQLDAQGKKYMETVLANTKRMGELIDDLLRLSRISKQGLNKSNVKMKELIENVYSELSSSTPTDKIKLTIGSLPVAHADSPLLKIVLTNLLSNAIKFSSKKREQIIEFGGKSNAKECVYYIKDNGVGFNMAYSSKLFDVFQRLHRTDEFEGTGIGLAIVRRIIHKHGGQVWAEAEIDKGATFYFSIPV